MRRTRSHGGVMATITSEEYATLYKIAEAMHKSGDYAREIKSADQAFNRILIGRDLGLSPAQAMMTIDLVRGNLMIRGVALAGFVRRSGRYDYELIKHDQRGCRLWFIECGGEGGLSFRMGACGR